MRIGIDIDGVLYPWDDCARDALVAKFGIERPGPSLWWSYLREVLAPSQWAWLWTAEGQNDAFGQTDRTYPGVVDAVNALLRHGDHEVHFVTHRDPRRTAGLTSEFLARHFGGHPWAGLHILRASVAKRTLARWDVFVDDKPDTVRDLLMHTEARVFCPVRPWNEELTSLGAAPGFTRYCDPQAFVHELVGVAA